MVDPLVVMVTTVLTIRQPCRECDRLVVVDSYRCFGPTPVCSECAKGRM